MMFKISFFVTIVYIVYVIGETKLLERQMEVDTYQQCKTDRDCKENSICVGNSINKPGTCTCENGFIARRNRTFYECLKEAVNITDSCVDDIQCQMKFSVDAECREGQCSCKSHAHFYNNLCWKLVRLNDTHACEVNENCLLKNNSFASCVDGKCTCDNLEHPVISESGDSCVINVKLGENCTSNDECFTENSRCIGVCRCKVGYITDYDEDNCIKASENIGDDCSTDIQCEKIENAHCASGKCDCFQKYHNVHNVCYKNVDLGNACTTSYECVSNLNSEKDVECGNGTCVCRTGRVQEERLCKDGGANITGPICLWTFLALVFLSAL